MIRYNSWIYYVPLLIIAVVMVLFPLTPTGDVFYLGKASKTILSGGLIYQDVEFTYPPIYAYLLAFAISLLGDNVYALKIFPVIFHICTAIILRKFVQEKWILYLYLLSPLPFLAASYWGGIDVIAAFFSVLSLILLLRGKLALSALSLAIGINIKYFPVILLIPFLLYLNRGRLRYLITVIATSLLVNLPFIILACRQWFEQVILFHITRNAGGYSLYNLFTWNFWGGSSETGILLPIALILLTFITFSRRENLVVNSAIFMVVTVIFNKVVLWYAQWFIAIMILSYYQKQRDKILLITLFLCQIFVYFGGHIYNFFSGNLVVNVVLILGWLYLLTEIIVLMRLFIDSKKTGETFF